MRPLLRVALIALITIVSVSDIAAQENWVGKTVFLKKSPTRIDVIDQNTKGVLLGELNTTARDRRFWQDGEPFFLPVFTNIKARLPHFDNPRCSIKSPVYSGLLVLKTNPRGQAIFQEQLFRG
jgi:hypothetical protein